MEEKQRNATEDLIQSLEKVSARMIEAVLQTAQLAATASPEVQSLFHQWVSCLEEQILEGGGLGIFAARAEGGAAGHLHGLFTLVAKHGREHARARRRPP